MERKFNEGDLVYIPQAVLLWDHNDYGLAAHGKTYITTEKPTTGICIQGSLPLENGERLVLVYAKGQRWTVHNKDVYPMEETNVG